MRKIINLVSIILILIYIPPGKAMASENQELIIESVSNGVMCVSLPLPDGINNYNLPPGHIWTIYAWASYTDGKEWHIEKNEVYAGIVENQYITVNIKLPTEKGPGWYAIRLEGENNLIGPGNMLWVNSNSKYAREDSFGYLGYELLVNHPSGVHLPVTEPSTTTMR